MANDAEIQSNRKASDKFHLIFLIALKLNVSEPSSSRVEQRFGNLFQFKKHSRKTSACYSICVNPLVILENVPLEIGSGDLE